MVVEEKRTGNLYPVNISLVEAHEYPYFKADHYHFNWEDESKHKVYKLTLVELGEVLGLISIEHIPQEWRIHIRLLTVSSDNKGRNKKYDGIAGCLLCHVAKLSIIEYGEMACVSLRPKTAIANHYIRHYGFIRTGITLALMLNELMQLINQFDHETQH